MSLLAERSPAQGSSGSHLWALPIWLAVVVRLILPRPGFFLVPGLSAPSGSVKTGGCHRQVDLVTLTRTCHAPTGQTAPLRAAHGRELRTRAGAVRLQACQAGARSRPWRPPLLPSVLFCFSICSPLGVRGRGPSSPHGEPVRADTPSLVLNRDFIEHLLSAERLHITSVP